MKTKPLFQVAKSNEALLGALLACSFVTIFGCSSGTGSGSSASTDSHEMAQFNANAYDLNKVVCDGTSPDSPNHGLKATLYYKTASDPIISTVNDIETKYHKSTQSLFFNNVNVPTRLFTAGFVTPTGETVKDDQGQTLIENFGIVFESELKLSSTDPEGDYEFASLADDGAKVEMQMPTGEWKTLINNDGDHPTRMGCSADSTTKTVHLVASESYPIRIHYYQGPRYHIANVLMWRLAGQARDVQCGQLGNSMYFDYNNNSAPTAVYQGLLARHWQVIPEADFYLPISMLETPQSFNPCFTGTAPVISNFQIGEVFVNQVTISWQTDVPATDQAIVKDATGKTVLTTTSDNVLRTSHSLTVTGLTNQTNYQVQAVSYSADQGMAISPTLTFTTQ